MHNDWSLAKDGSRSLRSWGTANVSQRKDDSKLNVLHGMIIDFNISCSVGERGSLEWFTRPHRRSDMEEVEVLRGFLALSVNENSRSVVLVHPGQL